jgi:hypothetical protein
VLEIICLLAVLITFGLPSAAMAQTNPSPRFNNLTMDGILAGAKVTATGGTTSRTLESRSADVYNTADQGAKCDGVTDDAPAINRSLALIRAKSAGGGTLEWPIGRQGRLAMPNGNCLIKSSLNMTGLYGSGFYADFGGSKLICQTTGTPCIDATGSGQITIAGLNIYGSVTNSPSIGLDVGRITNDGVGADHMVLDHPTITGYFTLAPYFNNQSESTVVNGGWFENQAAGAYGAIFDGGNHFNIQSAFTGHTYPQDTVLSFNENTCIECVVGTYGANSIPLWMGGDLAAPVHQRIRILL